MDADGPWKTLRRFPPTLDTLCESTSAHRATRELFLYGKEDRTEASSHPHAGVTPGGMIVKNRGPKVLEIDTPEEPRLAERPLIDLRLLLS